MKTFPYYSKKLQHSKEISIMVIKNGCNHSFNNHVIHYQLALQNKYQADAEKVQESKHILGYKRDDPY